MRETTTIRVSKKTVEALEHLREKLNAERLDEAIQSLIMNQLQNHFRTSLRHRLRKNYAFFGVRPR